MSEKDDKKTSEKDPKDLLKELRARYKACISNPDEKRNRDDAIADLKFVNVPEAQWEEAIKKVRGKDRPTYTFNNTRITIKNVVNDIRANRPQAKFRATEDSDKDTAETLNGLFRNMWQVSDGDTVMDYAAEYQVGGGMGAWRVTTEYSSDDAWDQDIVVEPIRNPFTLFADPGCVDTFKRDAMYWILTDKIKKSTYEYKWPKKEVVSFQTEDTSDDNTDWFTEEGEGFVRICEYWWKEPKDKVIALWSDGRTVDVADEPQPPPGVTVIKQRQVKGWAIKTAICSGNAILEGPTDWAGSMFPFVMVFGEYIVIDGSVYWFGLTRFAKDPQRAHNQALTGVFESIASASLSKYWATTVQADGHMTQWAEAHDKGFPVQLYNPDPQAPGPPQRMGAPDVPAALIEAVHMSTDALKSATGIFDPSIGRESNVTSGIALRSQSAQGKVATFNFSDNMSKAMQYTGEIFADLAPKIYDTARVMRILGADGSEKYAKLYEQGPDGKIINDLGRGKYDVTVTSGPSFATQRQEAVESYSQIAQANPAIMQVAGDLIMKAMDLPYSDQIAERLQALLPPQIQQTLNKDKPVPPEVQQAMAQVNQAMQQVEQHGQLVQQAEQEAQKTIQLAQADQAQSTKARSDLQIQLANLKTEEAKFGIMQAQFETQVVKSQSELQSLIDKLAMSETSQQQGEADRQDIDQKLADSVKAINDQTQGFLQQAASYLQNVGDGIQQQMQANPTQIIVQPHPRPIRIERQNGAMVPIYDNPQQ